MQALPLVFILLTSVSACAGQILLKRCMSGMPKDDGMIGSLIFPFLNPWVWAVVALAFVSMGCWAFVLRSLPLNVAFPFTGLTYVLVLASSWLILREPVSLMTVLGVGCICLGLVLAGLGMMKSP